MENDKMKKMVTVSNKLFILAALPLIFLVSIIVAIMFISANNNDTSQSTIETRLNRTKIVNSMMHAYAHSVIDVAHKARGGMLLWKDAEKTITKGKTEILSNWDTLNVSQLNPEERKLIETAKPLYEQSLQAIKKLEGYIKEQSSYSMGNFVDLELYSSLDPLLTQLDKFVLLQSKLASVEMDDTRTTTTQLNSILGMVTGGVIITVILLALSIIRSIKKPLSQLRQTMSAVEEHSNLSLRVNINSNDEFAEMGHNFNHMMEKIGLLFNQILESGKQLDQAAINMMSACEQANSQTSATESELSSATNSIEEMSKMTLSIQEFTNNTAQVTKEAESFLTDNFSTLQASSKLARELASAIKQSAEQVEILRDHSQRVDSILSVIKAVAEQTNLLALNAAIEAARAGEQGRGFAVVADEVRALAQRTQESTAEIETVIANIRESTEIVAEQMRSNANNVNENAETFEQSEDTLKQNDAALERIMSSFSNIVEQNESTQAIFGEQTQVVKSVNETVHRIYSLAENSNTATNSAFSNAQEVEQLSSKLKSSLASFSY